LEEVGQRTRPLRCHAREYTMTFYTVSTKQLAAACVLISILAAALSGINTQVRDYLLLPEVYYSEKDNACLKVVNYENGHAFNCNDVNVLLRRYRKVLVP
jgi:hypothetical protein